jgi:hypothetical protein
MDTRIGSSEFGDFQYAQFIEWCFYERQSKGGFLRNLAVARTESNQPVIASQREYYCKVYGIDPDELMRRILEADANGVSIVELHRQLTEEAMNNPQADLSLLPKLQEPKKRGRRPNQ